MSEFTELGKYPSDDAEAGDRAVLDQLAQHGQIGYGGGARQTEYDGWEAAVTK